MSEPAPQTESEEQKTDLVPLGDHSLAAELAIAEIDQNVAHAKKYPRNYTSVIQKIEFLATHNEAAADNCIYSLPRGGKPIIGPSIGFANVLYQAWGNCFSKGVCVAVDFKRKVVVAEGYFQDWESNTKVSVTEDRRIVDKNGKIYNDDMITVTGKAAAQIARRQAILNGVPRAIWFPTYEKALQTVRGTIETFAERKDKALRAFAQFGVKPDQIYGVLQLKGDADLTLEHIPILRGMYASLRDGSNTVEEMFDPRLMKGTNFETVANPLKDEETKKPRGRPRKPKQGEGVAVAHNTTAQPANAPAGPAIQKAEKPKNAEEYQNYLADWLHFAINAEEIEVRWHSERNLRAECNVAFEEGDKAREMKEARVKELTPQ